MTGLILTLLLAAEPQVGQPVTVTMKDGRELEGTLVYLHATEVGVHLHDGALVELERGNVVSVAPVVERTDDPNRTQYFFARSAFPMRHGEWFLSTKELASLFVSAGLLDVLTLELGTSALPLIPAIPTPGGGQDGLNVIFGARGGGQLGEYVFVSTGLQGLVLPLFSRGVGGIPLSGLVFGNVTVGTPNTHLTVQAGLPFNLAGSGDHLGTAPMLTLSGSLRVAKHLSVMTENWLYLDRQSTGLVYTVMNAAGVRFIWNTFSLSLGVLVVSNQAGFAKPFNYPLPLVDLIWNFQ